MMWTFRVAVVLAIASLSGCAVYEHRLIEPSYAAGVISQEPVSFTLEPLEYEAARHGDRLALRIHNHTHEPITLLGERSYLVDPSGETRPLRGGTIAPQSRITMLLPPEPTVVQTGPRFGVGVGIGTSFGRSGYYGGAAYDPWYHRPTYVYAGEAGSYWRWVIGVVQMRLQYDHAGEIFTHQLMFERVRVQ